MPSKVADWHVQLCDSEAKEEDSEFVGKGFYVGIGVYFDDLKKAEKFRNKIQKKLVGMNIPQ